MEVGVITHTDEKRRIFTVDNEYTSNWQNAYTPKNGDMVEYFPNARNKSASNVKFICKSIDFLDEYFLELRNGYFVNGTTYLRDVFYVFYPLRLAKIFKIDNRKNKSNQINKYFRYLKTLQGDFKLRKDFRFVEAKINEILPLLVYAKNKNVISEDFEKFLHENLQMAKLDVKNFNCGLIPHFQSLVAYSKIERS